MEFIAMLTMLGAALFLVSVLGSLMGWAENREKDRPGSIQSKAAAGQSTHRVRIPIWIAVITACVYVLGGGLVSLLG